MDLKDAKQYIKVKEGSLLPPSNISLFMCVKSFVFQVFYFLHP